MNTIAIVLILALLGASSPNPELEIGKTLPKADTEMKNIDGKMVSFNSLKKENGLLVIFSCNTCPWVIRWQDRYNELNDMAMKNDIGMVLVNSNEAYRGKDDSFEAMVEHAKKNSYSMPYTVDKNHEIADAFGANRTPHVFLFDKDDKLVYRGAIDDNAKSKEDVKEPYLKNAIKSIGSGSSISTKTTKSLGCTIKRIDS
jgi:thioredoxin-related protein